MHKLLDNQPTVAEFLDDAFHEFATELGTLSVFEAFEVLERLNDIELINLQRMVALILESRRAGR